MIKNTITNFYGQDHVPTVLDVGCADGAMWELQDVVTEGWMIHGVDTDYEILEKAAATNKFAELLDHAPFDPSLYDVTLMCGLLEHVENYWDTAIEYASSNAIVMTVPNAWSMHRLTGYYLGIINTPTDLDPGDIEIGHQRVFDPELWWTFLRLYAIDHNFKVEMVGSFPFKPFTSSQMIDAGGNEEVWMALSTAAVDLGLCGVGKIPNLNEDNDVARLKGWWGAELYAVLKKEK